MRHDVLLVLFAGCAYASSLWHAESLLSVWIAWIVAAMVCAWVWFGRWQAGLLAVAAVVVAVGALTREPASPLVSVPLLLGSLWLLMTPLPRLPAPSGDLPVGTQRFTVRAGRPVVVHAWYPAAPMQNSLPRKLHLRDEARAIRNGFLALGAPRFLEDHLRLVATHSVMDAPVLDGRFPIVVFNHGGALFPTRNFSMMEDLASHGYLCLSLGHPGESLGLVLGPEETAAIEREVVSGLSGDETFQQAVAAWQYERDPERRRENLERLAGRQENGPRAISERWARDSIEVIDAFAESSQIVGVPLDLAAAADTNRRVYAGMSLGGATAVLCGYMDERSAAVVNLDGMNWCFDRLGAPLRVPCLQCYADPNLAREPAERASGCEYAPVRIGPELAMPNDPWLKGAPEAVALIFPDAGHAAFTDLPLSARTGLRAALPWFPSSLGDAVDPSFCRDANALVRTFVDGALGRGSDDAFQRLVAALTQRGRVVAQLPEAADSSSQAS